jgi:hypothetical protein
MNEIEWKENEKRPMFGDEIVHCIDCSQIQHYPIDPIVYEVENTDR